MMNEIMNPFRKPFNRALKIDLEVLSKNEGIYKDDWTQLNPKDNGNFVRINPFLDKFLDNDNIKNFKDVVKGGLKTCLEKISVYPNHENNFISAEHEEWGDPKIIEQINSKKRELYPYTKEPEKESLLKEIKELEKKEKKRLI